MNYHRYETKLDHTSMLTIPISFIKTRMLKEIEKVLNKEFSSLFDWFLNNKLLIHFGVINQIQFFSLEGEPNQN